MNELLFLFHLALCVTITCASLRLGKEALLSWIVLLPILANLFVLKEIMLFSFTVTSCDVYAVSVLLANNLMQEHFGFESAKKAVTLSFLAMISFIAMSSLHLLYAAAPQDAAHSAYQAILMHTPRLVLASACSFLLVQQIDLRFFRFLKSKFYNMSLGMRNACCLSVAQFFDTLLFSFLGLYGLVSNLFEIFLISFALKCAIGSIMAFLPQTKFFKSA